MITDPVLELADVLRGRRIVVLTGAGCSTESGIPDYRGPDSRWKGRRPILYQQFLRSAEARARYWAGSVLGWPRIARARPNEAHRAIAGLERAERVRGVITQNVDGLHRGAGSRRLVELHGNLGRVICLDCGTVERRSQIQRRLIEANPGWRRASLNPAAVRDAGAVRNAGTAGAADSQASTARAELAPDGDVGVNARAVRTFRVPDCRHCQGVLKPDVVFFGENVPPDRVERAWRLFEAADALLVVGSSLEVYSGRRFVDRAARVGMPVGIVNLGGTRADGAAAARVEGRAASILPRLADALRPDALSPRPPSSTESG